MDVVSRSTAANSLSSVASLESLVICKYICQKESHTTKKFYFFDGHCRDWNYCAYLLSSAIIIAAAEIQILYY